MHEAPVRERNNSLQLTPQSKDLEEITVKARLLNPFEQVCELVIG